MSDVRFGNTMGHDVLDYVLTFRFGISKPSFYENGNCDLQIEFPCTKYTPFGSVKPSETANCSYCKQYSKLQRSSIALLSLYKCCHIAFLTTFINRVCLHIKITFYALGVSQNHYLDQGDSEGHVFILFILYLIFKGIIINEA